MKLPITGDTKVYCKQCHALLDAVYLINTGHIEVNPCQACLDFAHGKGQDYCASKHE